MGTFQIIKKRLPLRLPANAGQNNRIEGWQNLESKIIIGTSIQVLEEMSSTPVCSDC